MNNFTLYVIKSWRCLILVNQSESRFIDPIDPWSITSCRNRMISLDLVMSIFWQQYVVAVKNWRNCHQENEEPWKKNGLAAFLFKCSRLLGYWFSEGTFWESLHAYSCNQAICRPRDSDVHNWSEGLHVSQKNSVSLWYYFQLTKLHEFYYWS